MQPLRSFPRETLLVPLLTLAAAIGIGVCQRPQPHRESGEAALPQSSALTQRAERQEAERVRQAMNARGAGAQIAIGRSTHTPAKEETPVLRVRADGPMYWRERTFARYTGRCWIGLEAPSESLHPRRGPDAQGTYTFDVREPGDGPRAWRVSSTYQVQHLARTAGSLLVAGEPVRIRIGSARLVRRRDQTLGTTLARDASYSVQTAVCLAPAEALNRSPMVYPEGLSPYLDLGAPHPALRALAREAIGKARGPYAKAEAIRLFIAQRCGLTPQAPAVPSGEDVAVFFLTRSRKGYFDLFATGTTLLCRYAGLPARLVTGFYPLAASKARLYSLRSCDRRAWAEVYFVGYGWIPLDPTRDDRPVLQGSPAPAQMRRSTRALGHRLARGRAA